MHAIQVIEITRISNRAAITILYDPYRQRVTAGFGVPQTVYQNGFGLIRLPDPRRTRSSTDQQINERRRLGTPTLARERYHGILAACATVFRQRSL